MNCFHVYFRLKNDIRKLTEKTKKAEKPGNISKNQ